MRVKRRREDRYIDVMELLEGGPVRSERILEVLGPNTFSLMTEMVDLSYVLRVPAPPKGGSTRRWPFLYWVTGTDGPCGSSQQDRVLYALYSYATHGPRKQAGRETHSICTTIRAWGLPALASARHNCSNVLRRLMVRGLVERFEISQKWVITRAGIQYVETGVSPVVASPALHGADLFDIPTEPEVEPEQRPPVVLDQPLDKAIEAMDAEIEKLELYLSKADRLAEVKQLLRDAGLMPR